MSEQRYSMIETENINQDDLFERILSVIAKAHGLKVLRALKSGEKSQKDISFDIRVDKAIVHRRLKEFKEMGLVEERFDYSDRLLKYRLTDFGKQILEWLESAEPLISVIKKHIKS